MSAPLAALVAAITGGLVALQAPINGKLGQTIGALPAAAVSFLIGTVALALLAATVGGGFGRAGEVRALPWYYLTGGLLGATFVTVALITVQTLGAGGLTAAIIAGQLGMSVVIDRFGLLGVARTGIAPTRIVGLVLLAIGVVLVVRR